MPSSVSPVVGTLRVASCWGVRPAHFHSSVWRW